MTWSFYADPGLTVDVSAGIPVSQVAGGSAANAVVYFGNPTAGATLQAASSPGFDPITLTPADTTVSSGVETSMIKLATSFVGLDAATAGAALTIGTSLSSGVANAVTVYMRVDAGSLSTSGTPYTDGGVQLNETVET